MVLRAAAPTQHGPRTHLTLRCRGRQELTIEVQVAVAGVRAIFLLFVYAAPGGGEKRHDQESRGGGLSDDIFGVFV